MTKNDIIVKVDKIMSISQHIKLKVFQLSVREDFFQHPMPSSYLSIFKGNPKNLAPFLTFVKQSDLKYKLFCIKIKNNDD